MKKLLLVLILLLSLCGCSESGAKKVVSDELKVLKQETTESINNSEELASLSTEQHAYIQQMYKLLYEFDYKILDVEEKDNSATVNVKISTYDVVETFTALESDPEIIALSQELSSNYTEEKEKELMAKYALKITEALNTNGKTYSVTLGIPCVKENDEWKIDPNFDLSNEVQAVATSSLLELSNIGE